MRYYWEALFSTEYFPYWEFTMLMMLCIQISYIWRLHRMEKKLNGLVDDMWHVIKDIAEEYR
jgi:hypothetical protein